MKKTFIAVAAVCAAVLMSGCGVTMFNNVNSSGSTTQVELSNANFRVVDNVEGTSSASYVFGIGGLSHKAVHDNAVADMFKNARLTGAQTIANIYVKSHVATILGLYTRVTYSASGQVIEFISNDSGTYDNIKTYKVGDMYDDGVKHGVVFHVSEDGRHGKIVYPEILTSAQWCTTRDATNKVVDDNDGEYNMGIIKGIDGWQNKYPAFAACAELGDSWYLPSKNELKEVYAILKRSNIPTKRNGMLIDFWSSTGVNNKKAISYWTEYSDMTSKLPVIAVSKF